MLDRTEERPPVERNKTEARAGVTGHNVRYVLAIGLSLAIIALGLLWFFWALPQG